MLVRKTFSVLAIKTAVRIAIVTRKELRTDRPLVMLFRANANVWHQEAVALAQIAVLLIGATRPSSVRAVIVTKLAQHRLNATN